MPINTNLTKILYLCPLIPAKSGTGGKRAAFNHLLDLKNSKVDVSAIFINVDENFDKNSSMFDLLQALIFERKIPKAGKKFTGKLLALAQFFFSVLPRSVAVVSSKQAISEINNLLSSFKYDLIIIDHLNAYGLIRNLQTQVPVMYIAHNVESEVLRHRVDQLNFWSIFRWLTHIDRLKMINIESELLRIANYVVVIGSADLEHDFIKGVDHKVSVWPELPEKKSLIWKYSGLKKILFVGSAQYFPNRDAIDWLLKYLMPRIFKLNPNIRLHIIGSYGSEFGLPDINDSFQFEGYVSDEALESFHLNADLFICPVILGGGIKIKLLEAASYGVPIAATNESLNGIDFLHDTSFEFSRNNDQLANEIVELLADDSRLLKLSSRSLRNLSNARESRPDLLSLFK